MLCAEMAEVDEELPGGHESDDDDDDEDDDMSSDSQESEVEELDKLNNNFAYHNNC